MTIVADQPANAVPGRPRPPRRWLATVLVVVAVVAGAVATRQLTGGQDQATGSGASPGFIAGEDDMSGDELLKAVAAQITDTPSDVRSGTYTRLRRIVWGKSIQGPIEAAEQTSWHSPDGKVYLGVTRRIDDIGVPVKEFDPIVSYRALTFDGVEPTVVDSRADRLTRTPDVTLPGGDAQHELTWMLDVARQFDDTTPRVRVDELLSLYTRQAVPKLMRAAILRILADLPDVAFTHVRMRDAAQREGLGFKMFSHGDDYTLIIDPATGELLAAQRLYLGQLFSYELLLPTQWTNQLGEAAPTPVSTIIPTQTAWPAASGARP